MGAARYVGRAGRLAVALGIGTAIASGHGVAWADQSDNRAPASPPAASSPGENAGGSDTSGNPTKPRRGKPKPKPKPDDAKAQTPSTETQTDKPPTSKPETDAPKLDEPETTGRDSGNRPKNAGANDPAKPATATVPKTPKTPRLAPTTLDAAKPVADPKPTASKPVSVAATAPAVVKLTTAAAITTAPTPIAATTNLVTPNVTTAAEPLNPVAAVVKAVSGVLNWAFNPNGSPTEPTLAWTVLAFARREIDNLLTAIKPPAAAATDITTSQPLTAVLASAVTAINPRPAWSWISNNGGSWTTRWWCGAANSGAHHMPKMAKVVIITQTPSRCGWQVAA